MLIEVKNWSLVLGKITIKNLLLIPIKFSIGRISFYPKSAYWLVAGIWTSVLAVAGLTVAKKNKFWLMMLIVPLFLGMIFSWFSPMMQYFRFLYLVPMAMIILAKTRWRWLIGGGLLIFSLAYLINPDFHREDWKSLAKDLGDEVYMIGTVADPVKYYRPEIIIKDIRNPTGGIIEVVPYAEEIHGLDHKLILTKAGYQRIEEKAFRELKKEKWSL